MRLRPFRKDLQHVLFLIYLVSTSSVFIFITHNEDLIDEGALTKYTARDRNQGNSICKSLISNSIAIYWVRASGVVILSFFSKSFLICFNIPRPNYITKSQKRLLLQSRVMCTIVVHLARSSGVVILFIFPRGRNIVSRRVLTAVRVPWVLFHFPRRGEVTRMLQQQNNTARLVSKPRHGAEAVAAPWRCKESHSSRFR